MLFRSLQVIDKMASFIERFNDSILQGSKSLKGPKMAALTSAIIRIITTSYFLIRMFTRHSTSGCSGDDIHNFSLRCLQLMWTSRASSHGWSTVMNIFDCLAMILMIWVFDGLRTVNKDKDIGSLMVGCMKLATLINVITSLLETGMGNYARYIAGSWAPSWGNESPNFAYLEIAHLLAQGSFSWLFTVDDFIMVVPYFWAYKLAQDNDKIPKTYAIESLLLAVLSFIFFCFGMYELVSQVARVFEAIVGICYILIRFIWLFHSYVIFKGME